jgi:UDP-glucose 4-epimerase
MLNGKTILITGGCGFIGVNLIRHLLGQGKNHRVRVLDNLSVGKKEDLGLIAEFIEVGREEIGQDFSHKVELIVGDVCDEDLTTLACHGAESVVHLAASTGVIPSIENPKQDCRSNVIGALNCLESARINRIKRFVFASSGAPLGEQNPPIHEEMAPHPISPYGASKLAGEAYCSAYHASFGLQTVVLRFANVYGPHSNNKSSVMAKFIKHILASEALPIYGDGNQTRDFVYVDDLVQAISLSLEQPKIGGQIFQIATHEEHTITEVGDELNRLAEKYLGHKSPITYEKERKGEIRRSYSDIDKARTMLGFEPKYTLKRGLAETFSWFLENSL